MLTIISDRSIGLRPHAFVALAVIAGCAAVARASDINTDEEVIFFPTHAVRDGNQWSVPVHAWVFEPEPDSRWRDRATRAFAAWLDVEPDDPGYERCLRRARWFVVDNERGQSLTVVFGEGDARQRYRLGDSQPNGHVHHLVSLPASAGNGGDWLTYRLLLDVDDPRVRTGRVQLLEPAGVTVISDLDDTLKISEVGDARALLRRTLAMEHEAVPGMAGAFRQWAEQGVAFHYVTASPHQVYPHIAPFMEEAGFPTGAWTMKHVRLKDETVIDLVADPMKCKLEAIEPILKRFPKRHFVLIGDSGEKDPEAYGELARRYPKQIGMIFIRIVGDAKPEAARLAEAMKDVPEDRWQLFESADALQAYDPVVDR